jgi:UDP-N-acetyl-D-mannosaminuronic acid dehydrogenase
LKIGEKIHLAHCPERILPGNVFHEIQYNDRIIGGCTNEASMMAREIYSSFVKGNIFITDDVTAEFCKLAENTYRDVNIALANELALVADAIGIDARTAIDLANKHPRVNILNPGIGVGGHCIPIDPWFLKEVDPKHTSLILAARRVNDHMPALVAARIRKELKDIENPRIVVLGITYKPDTNDLRESPALEIIRQLQEDGYDVRYHDPVVEGRGYDSISDVAEAADCLAVLVPHRRIIEELNADKEAICGRMRTPKILIF